MCSRTTRRIFRCGSSASPSSSLRLPFACFQTDHVIMDRRSRLKELVVTYWSRGRRRGELLRRGHCGRNVPRRVLTVGGWTLFGRCQDGLERYTWIYRRERGRLGSVYRRDRGVRGGLGSTRNRMGRIRRLGRVLRGRRRGFGA